MNLCLRKQVSVSIFLLVIFAAPQFSVGAEDPWDFLEGFNLIPGSEARVERHYVAALYEKPDEGLLAVVVFNAECSAESCRVNHRAAYSVFDDEGANVRRYIDPREHELMELILERSVV